MPRNVSFLILQWNVQGASSLHVQCCQHEKRMLFTFTITAMQCCVTLQYMLVLCPEGQLPGGPICANQSTAIKTGLGISWG